jgi:hypothetical protein
MRCRKCSSRCWCSPNASGAIPRLAVSISRAMPSQVGRLLKPQCHCYAPAQLTRARWRRHNRSGKPHCQSRAQRQQRRHPRRQRRKACRRARAIRIDAHEGRLSYRRKRRGRATSPVCPPHLEPSQCRRQKFVSKRVGARDNGDEPSPHVFTGTKRMVGRLIASQSASASTASFLPRLTYGLTS